MSKRQGRRAKGLGTIFQEKDGTYRSRIQIGYDAKTGRPKYITCRRKTEKDALAWYRKNIHRSSARLIEVRPPRHLLTAHDYRQTMREQFSTWRDVTELAAPA